MRRPPSAPVGPSLAGLVLPDVRTGAMVDLGTFSGVLVAIRHHG